MSNRSQELTRIEILAGRIQSTLADVEKRFTTVLETVNQRYDKPTHDSVKDVVNRYMDAPSPFKAIVENIKAVITGALTNLQSISFNIISRYGRLETLLTDRRASSREWDSDKPNWFNREDWLPLSPIRNATVTVKGINENIKTKVENGDYDGAVKRMVENWTRGRFNHARGKIAKIENSFTRIKSNREAIWAKPEDGQSARHHFTEPHYNIGYDTAYPGPGPIWKMNYLRIWLGKLIKADLLAKLKQMKVTAMDYRNNIQAFGMTGIDSIKDRLDLYETKYTW